ncbi:cellulose binding domain-containing protein [Streptosporangium sp. NPDC002524]|uniref:cellulose binding domain-containing protein n=1 Tax=Streptosporangium sp. NPDC002524 TaxID=3154537 RepID=UPI00332E30D9
MRVTTWLAGWIGGGVTAAALVILAAGNATAAPSPAPSPSPSGALPCRTVPRTLAPSSSPPTTPGTPEILNVTLNSVRLSWAASTDQSGIACYYVYEDRNGTAARVATFQPAVTEGTVLLPFPPINVESEVHHLYVVAVDSTGEVSSPSGTVAVTIHNDRPPVPGGCEVKYTSWPWGTGMSTNIRISNTGSATFTDWRLTFAFADPGQRVTSGWSATWSQTASAVTAVNQPWNRDLAPGQSLLIGFQGTHTGANPPPAAFRFNGIVCAQS